MAKCLLAPFCLALAGTLAANAQTAPADAISQDGPQQDLWAREHLTGDWRGLRTALENRGVSLSLEQEAET
jgi:hypothetical protein